MEPGNWICWIVLPLAGFVGMVSGGYWGIGCSWLIVPTTLLLGATPMEAAGIALLQMVPSILPVAVRDAPILGWSSGSFGRNLVIPLALASLLFSFLGRPVNVFLYDHFGATAFQCFFAAVMIYLGLKIFFSRPVAYGASLPVFGSKNLPSAYGFGALVGLLSSLLGIGGGMFFRPLLAGYYQVPEKETANAVRLLLLLTAFGGGVAYVFTTEGIHWQIPCFAGLVTLGGMAGFPLGVRIHRVVLDNGYARHIHKSFAIIAFIVVINLIFTVAGQIAFCRYLMMALAVLLLVYLVCFARYTARHPHANDYTCGV